MCSRYILKLGHRIDLAKRLGIPLQDAHTVEGDRYNIAPSTVIITFRATATASGTTTPAPARSASPVPPEAVALHWGLIPHWTRDRHAPNAPLINARSETVAEKPSFRFAWQRGQRCIVPASGFYEWERDGRSRLPWLFARTDDRPLLLAGLWDRWHDPINNTLIESCTLLTTTPNPLLAKIHDRMPVIVTDENLATWLDLQLPITEATAMMQPFDADQMTATALDPYVNATAHEGPACLTPRGQSPGAQLGLGW